MTTTASKTLPPEPPESEWGLCRCQNCDLVDSEEEFTPSDGNRAPLICPKCGSTNCFIDSEEDT